MLTLVLNRESQEVGVLFVLNKQGCEEFQNLRDVYLLMAHIPPTQLNYSQKFTSAPC